MLHLHPQKYLVTGDDFSTVKLFRYPVVAKGAPFKAYKLHCSHVTSVRFSPDGRYVLRCARCLVAVI